MIPLDEQCGEALPPQAQEALRLFKAGEFYKQHDLFEALWRDTPEAVRDLYQGVLQVGVGYYQITQGNQRGALKMLQRAKRWLTPLPDVCQGINVAKLRADAQAVSDELKRLGADKINEFDRTLLKSVEYRGGTP